jgi:PadR family transcriptional regulator, regulatory protein PadR
VIIKEDWSILPDTKKALAKHDTLLYNAFMETESRWESQLRKGSLDLAVLASLSLRARYGLEIIKILRESAGFELAEGTLYPILMRLTEESLLKSEWVEAGSGHPRKYYQITPEGRRRAAEMLGAWDEFSSSMARLLDPLRSSNHASANARQGRRHE